MSEFLINFVIAAVALLAGVALGRYAFPRLQKRYKRQIIFHPNATSSDDRAAGLCVLPKSDDSVLSGPKGKKRRLIIVAKQLPVNCKRGADGKWHVEWDDARSFLGNLRVLKKHGMQLRWVGSPGVDVAKEEQDQLEEALLEHNCVPVFLPAELQDRFFNGFCKEVLWPLLHYVMPHNNLSFGKRWDAVWQGYTAANQTYSNVVARVAESQHDSIWIQNYHLLLMPSFLRKKLPRAKIGIFIHTPFPSSDVFRMLPTRENILRGIMCADLVGFHTFDYARHFLSCCKRVLDLDFETMPGGTLGVKYSGRYVSILISHVGIESQQLREVAQLPEVVARAEQLRKQFHPRKIVVGVDDLDLVKGSLLKMQAYQRFLQNYTEHRDKVVLFNVFLPTSMSSASKQVVRDAIQREIGDIRRQYGDGVIEVIERDSIDLKETVALYLASHVAVVSAFWDGLNLAPYEYTASQDPANPGALVLSEFMGCTRSLSGVLRVNPWSLDQVADSIHQALAMSLEERQANHQRRAQYVMNHTLERWAIGFLRNLDQATQLCGDLNYVQVGWGSNVRLVGLRSDFTHLDASALAPVYRRSFVRLMLFDYDGTLTPAQDASTSTSTQPAAAAAAACSSADVKSGDASIAAAAVVPVPRGPSEALKSHLKSLTADPRNVVFILTGRNRHVLSTWFADLPELGLAAEKGVFLRWPKRWRDKVTATGATLVRATAAAPVEADAPSSDVVGAGVAGSSSSLTAPVTLADWELACPVDDFSWKRLALEVIRIYTEATDGSWIEDKEFGIVWHYENADPEYGRMQANELAKYLVKVVSNPQIDIVKYDYNRIVEVKPRGVNKGTTASIILEAVFGGVSAQQSQQQASSCCIMAIGDDRSDEDMFKAVQTHMERVTSGLGTGSAALPSSASEPILPTVQSTPASPLAGPLSPGSSSSSSGSAASAAAAAAKRHFPNVFTCCVGIKPSLAHYYLHDDEEVCRLVETMAQWSRKQDEKVPGIPEGRDHEVDEHDADGGPYEDDDSSEDLGLGLGSRNQEHDAGADDEQPMLQGKYSHLSGTGERKRPSSSASSRRGSGSETDSEVDDEGEADEDSDSLIGSDSGANGSRLTRSGRLGQAKLRSRVTLSAEESLERIPQQWRHAAGGLRSRKGLVQANSSDEEDSDDSRPKRS